ncbi:MAG TPA: AMIN domain-containing protein, partial [Burkholderiaceae bacterium]
MPDPAGGRARKRRTLLKAGGTLLLSVFTTLPARAAQIMAVRVWPAPDYTRVTLENDSVLKTTHFLAKDPHRLVVDIEGLELNATLKGLVAKIKSGDPYIKQVRVGQNRPNVVRLVFDLKEAITPQVFTLAPVGEYQHRLIFDLYPVQPVDPIAALIEKGEWSRDQKPVVQPLPGEKAPVASAPAVETKPAPKPEHKPAVANTTTQDASRAPEAAPARAGKPEMQRMLTIVLDPGHGGEDPGAIGAKGSREKDVVLAIAKRIKQKIEDQPNMRVMLTREGDY